MNGYEVVGKAATRNQKLVDAGFDTVYYVTVSNGQQYTVFYNKVDEVFGGAHLSSSN